MKGFLSFRHFKRLLKIAAMAWALTVGGSVWAVQSITYYYYLWTGAAGDSEWNSTGNWKYYKETQNYPDDQANPPLPKEYKDLTPTWSTLPENDYPNSVHNIAIFKGDSPTTIKLANGITINSTYFNIGGSNKISINLNSKTLTCTQRIILNATYDQTFNSDVEITGDGSVITKTFDFPNNGSHYFRISESTQDSTSLTITETLWANSNPGKLYFTGKGYLYMPKGGANVNWGAANIDYSGIDSTHRLPYTGTSYSSYSFEKTLPSESSPDGVVFTFTKGNNEGDTDIIFPFKVIKKGSETYKLNGKTLNNGDVYTGKANGSTGSSNISNITIPNGMSKSYTLSCTNPPTTKGNGITIIFYSPDGQYPSDSTEAGTKSFMEIGRLSWYLQTPSWTGEGSDQLWTNKDNWSGLPAIPPGKDFPDLSNYDIEISETRSTKQPIIDRDISVKSLTITGGSKVTHIGGKLTTNSLDVVTPSKFEYTANDEGKTGILELVNDDTTAATIKGFSTSYIFTYKLNLSIAEGASFTMPFDMTLNMLTINSGASFKMNGHTADIGRLQVQTANYSGRSGTYKNITLEETLEADDIIILLRDGDIIAEKNLTAHYDFIIGGADYNGASVVVGYDHFINRPSESEGWVQSHTRDVSLKIDGGPLDKNSAFKLNSGVTIKAGAGSEKKGNFYMCGARLLGTDATNTIEIRRNDTPVNFCAEAIHSEIKNITVVCSDYDGHGHSSDTGDYAQIPYSGNISLDETCKNFDTQEFGISSATTVSDNRIYLKFPRPIRKITYPSAIKTSDGTGFTAEYASETGTDAPANPKISLYLYTENTTWNTDASGTSAGSGNYTNSKGEYRTVIPYLVIPQYITDSSGNVTCGYLITDKWGKRLKTYAPDASAFKDITDGIPEDEKKKREPPAFSISLSPVNNNQIVLGFSKPIITSSSKISYYIDSDNRISISQTMEELLPRCFEIVSIDPAGNAASADIQIDKNSRASISQSSTGLSTITLTLTRNITLSDIENLYIRLIAPKDDSGNLLYPITTYDHQTGKTGLAVSFIQESDKAHTKDGAIYMALNTAHSISDFAIGAINPSYAYNSGISDGGEDLASAYRNIYGEGSSAVHDFSKNQKNYGTISYGSEITLVSKSTSSINSLKLFITDDVDSDSFFKTFSSNFDKQSEAWLPNLTGKIFNYYSSALNSNFQTFNGEAIKSGASNQGFNTIIPKESVIKMKSGSQLSFVYTICDSSQNPLSHILSPIMTNTETGTYDLSKSVTYPLFALNLSNSSDLLSLSPWYITLKSITEQRGGVTILNNVINAAAGEKTVLKVNMPSSGNLDIMIMTIDGNIVKYLAHGNAGAGEHFYYWDGRNNAGSEVARGMYFVIIKGPGIDENRKVMVVK